MSGGRRRKDRSRLLAPGPPPGHNGVMDPWTVELLATAARVMRDGQRQGYAARYLRATSEAIRHAARATRLEVETVHYEHACVVAEARNLCQLPAVSCG